MKRQIKSGLKLSAALLVSACLGFAQANVSAPVRSEPQASATASAQAPAQKQGVPGTINYVEGQAMVDGKPLGPGSAGYTVVQPNQPIQTQAGFVEVLLTPGAFLRIGHNSEVVMQSLGLANIHLQVVHGSAMVEAADLVKGTIMQVNMNGATTQVEKRGLYEFDANQQLVRVLDGKVKVLEGSGVKSIGKGDQLMLADANLKPHGFDKHVAETDPLYVWSKARSETEAKANAAVASNVAIYGGWYGPGWYWDPFWAQYAFLPGTGFLYSPFGWGFYSPTFIYAVPYHRGFYGRGHYYAARHYAHVGGMSAGIRSNGGGLHGGFHGNGGHR
jgi:hypothetical protein